MESALIGTGTVVIEIEIKKNWSYNTIDFKQQSIFNINNKNMDVVNLYLHASSDITIEKYQYNQQI